MLRDGSIGAPVRHKPNLTHLTHLLPMSGFLRSYGHSPEPLRGTQKEKKTNKRTSAGDLRFGNCGPN
ncbi:hypothetical protein NDU88_010357 [Pleurodeles waltl]|uniref:Uncharacterized protein n=1 Tax=Pleurodeles waltl TaxID=8319 RepID=A0AAV7S3S1_PLEWA|nr:hypothetical protein NDU88_010357 [Pleurodeles waltl]